ncbi:MAG: TatD family hydrolase, partial [Candidatus Sedimenticola sp. (ex Thyasira tokunagai)]
LQILQEEGADRVGGVMHCFTEDWDMAKAALDMGFYISFSGIITFNSAADLREVAKKVPEDRILIETDAPYLAPAPHRGKPNIPAYVALVADKLAEVRGVERERVVETTGDNFFRLFSNACR